MTGIELRGVSVALDGRPVLRDLDLTVPQGSFFALLGPSGCSSAPATGCWPRSAWSPGRPS